MNNIIFIDGDCTLCNRFTRLLSVFDRQNIFKIYPLDPIYNELNTVVLFRENKFLTKYEAISDCMKQLNSFFKFLFIILDKFPLTITNTIYDFIAKNRNKIMSDTCKPIPANKRLNENEVDLEIVEKAYKFSKQ